MGAQLTQLPPALRAWGPQLEIFDGAVRAGVGALASSIGLLLGDAPSRAVAPDGEPAGYDGLSRRGVYERLLATEWAIAAEHPEEFLRRAAEREHLFFGLARESRRGDGAIHVLFDGGPDQLGGPRIAQLAVLVAFARRAGQLGAQLRWAGLQEDAATWEEGLTSEGVKRFLASRSHHRPEASDIERWAGRANADDRESRELWFVGGSVIGGLAPSPAANRVVVDEVIDTGADAVELTVLRKSRPARAACLKLPNPDEQVRLLRAPFPREADRKKAPRTYGGIEPGMFFPTPQRVVARSRLGDLLAFHVPNSPRASLGRTRTLDADGWMRFIAGGVVGKTLFGVALVDGELSSRGLEHYLDDCRWSVPADTRVVANPEAPLQRAYLLRSPAYMTLVMLDAERSLWLLPNDSAQARLLARGVTDITHRNGSLYVLAGDLVGLGTTRYPQDVLFVVDVRGRTQTQAMPVGRMPDARFGPRWGEGVQAHGAWGAVYYPNGPSTWNVVDGASILSVGVSGGERVHGMVRDPRQGYAPALVVTHGIMASRRVELVSEDHRRVLLRTAGPVVDVVVSPHAPEVAVLQSDGTFLCYSITYDAELFRHTAS